MKKIIGLVLIASIMAGCGAIEQARVKDNPTPQQIANVEEAKRYDKEVVIPSIIMLPIQVLFDALLKF